MRLLACLLLTMFLGCATTTAEKSVALSQPCDSMNQLELVTCLAARGYTRWGCNSTEATVDWGPPETGTPAVYYRLELRVVGTAGFPPQTVAIPDWADTAWVRCVGVDSLGRYENWSEWSDPHIPR